MTKHKIQRHLTTKQRFIVNILSFVEVVSMMMVALHIINTTYSVPEGIGVFLGVSLVYLIIVLCWLRYHDKKLANHKRSVKNG